MDNDNIKILVVDDEPDILEFISYNLKKENFKVKTATNGKEALAQIEKRMPDLIILDIMMPEMDGIELCHLIRSKKKYEHIIIAFLTARSEDFTQIAALDMGGDDFIQKPIKPRLLLSRIKALLRRQAKTPGAQKKVIKIGDLTIDKEAVRVVYKNKKIEFAKKEFKLLYLLASKPGKVFTREEIFNKIWGSDVIVGNRTIDVHIRKIREKLGDKFIKTVKGIGYKFEL